MKNWLRMCCRRPVVMRSLKVAIVVGTALVVINHVGSLLRGELHLQTLLKIALTYLMPYGVVTYAAVGSLRIREWER